MLIVMNHYQYIISYRNPHSFLFTLNVYILNEKEEKEKLIYIALFSFIRNFVLIL